MKATLTYEGKTVEVEIAEDEARKIFAELKKTGWERVEVGGVYHCLDRGGVAARRDSMKEPGYSLYKIGNYFSDDALANDQARAIFLWLRIKRWAAEHCKPVNWNCQDIGKFYIFYNRPTRKVEIRTAQTLQDAFQVYFDTYEHAKQCVEEFRDDLLWYFTECRDRMDG